MSPRPDDYLAFPTRGGSQVIVSMGFSCVGFIVLTVVDVRRGDPDRLPDGAIEWVGTVAILVFLILMSGWFAFRSWFKTRTRTLVG